MPRTAIKPEGFPSPPVPLSPGVRKGNILQVAGQVSFEGKTVADQTRQVLRQMLAVLEAGGATADDLIMVRVYLTDTDHFAEMNDVYKEFFTEPYPARTTVFVGLSPGVLVEVDALAVLGD
jgi:2-iminobutanoate/2-iminopropanoate deaminase